MDLGTSADHPANGTRAADRRILARVAVRQDVASEIALFELVDAAQGTLPPFSAGSHIDVVTPRGAVRQYSLCNDPAERGRYQIAVLREGAGRGGSRSMHDSLREGDVLPISEPKNHFPLVEDAVHSVLLAGGIGITPLIAMAERLHRLHRSFELHYCSRTRGRAAFIERIGRSPYAHRVHFHFDDGPSDQKLQLGSVFEPWTPGMHLYACGPTAFMEAVLHRAGQAGWAQDALHREYFGPAAAPAGAGAGEGFEVQIHSTGQVIEVLRGETVVQALSKHGVHIPVSCEQGVCGTCITGVLRGEVDHRDMFLQPDERIDNRQFLPCCSRAKSARLVLDL